MLGLLPDRRTDGLLKNVRSMDRLVKTLRATDGLVKNVRSTDRLVKKYDGQTNKKTEKDYYI